MYKKVLYIILGLVVTAAAGIAAVVTYYELRYPLKYQQEVEIFSEKYSLDKSLVNSVINAESRFKHDAVSRAGAMGLMQIMPRTAVWLAGEIGLEEFSIESLYTPAVNIEIGTYYLKYLLDKFSDTDVALAAYNAGEGTVSLWLLNGDYSANGRLTVIPYKETNDYVSKINKYRKVYEKRA